MIEELVETSETHKNKVNVVDSCDEVRTVEKAAGRKGVVKAKVIHCTVKKTSPPRVSKLSFSTAALKKGWVKRVSTTRRSSSAPLKRVSWTRTTITTPSAVRLRRTSSTRMSTSRLPAV